MPGAARRERHGRGFPDPTVGVRALAAAVGAALLDLINEVTGEAGTPLQPALAGVTPGARARARSVPPVAALRVDVQADRTLPDSTTRATRPAADAGMDTDHAAAWQLVERAQAGDGEAFGQLYDRYVDTVFRFVYYRVNDRALAEDFTSETFLRALRRIGTISYQGRDIGAWFVTIARNIVFDHMKSARRRLEITTADTIERDDHQPGPEATVVAALTNERLMAAVAQLGDEQRECVLLRFIQGFSVSETAAVMGKNEGAIKALQHRAIHKLAESVGRELR